MTGSVLRDWRRLLDRRERRAYWPGPRPMQEDDDAAQLVGRDKLIHSFIRSVWNKPLVVLNGESGVGKSSLLNLGIGRQLVNQDFAVFTCNSWAGLGVSDDLDPEEAFAQVSAKLESKLRESGSSATIASLDDPALSDEEDFVARVDEIFGRRAVVILDQFEELIRHELSAFSHLKAWIERLIASTDVHVVISLRSEFVQAVASLDVSALHREDVEVDAIRSPEMIRQIVESGRVRGDAAREAIDPVAADRLVELWVAAGGERAWSGIGLLHLQALLYLLWRDASRNGAEPNRVTLADVAELERRREADDEQNVFKMALADVVDARLQQCLAAYEEVAGDASLATGTLVLVTRMSEYLSSGGYKVDQERWHLAELALQDELDVLGVVDFEKPPGESDYPLPARALFDAVAAYVDRSDREGPGPEGEYSGAAEFDYLSASRDELLKFASPAARALIDEYLAQLDPAVPDEDEVSAGVMLGENPTQVVIEEFRRFFFALDWLEESDVVRRVDSPEDDVIYSLVHDGFGKGLDDWAREVDDPAEAPFVLLTAASGVVFRWKAPIAPEAGDAVKLVVNTRWKSCFVDGAHFSRVLFVNCDFTNTTFIDCDFTAVGFVNCILDGVTFSTCTFRGRPGGAAPASMPGMRHVDRDDSPFYLEAADEVRALRRYRPGSEAGGDQLLSLVSTSAALPRVEGDSPDALPVETPLGGVVLYGGRLSSLMFNECDFGSDGELMLRQVIGTSVEFGEQLGGRVTLFEVAIRGLTVSPHDAERQRKGGDFTLTAEGSTLQNLWFSERIHGTADFTDCTVWQLFNGSDDMRLKLADSEYFGVIDTALAGADRFVDASTAAPGALAEAIDEARRVSGKIDFRSTRWVAGRHGVKSSKRPGLRRAR